MRNPVNATPDDMRNNLRKAVMLLKEAGWEVKNGVLTNVQDRPEDEGRVPARTRRCSSASCSLMLQNLDRLGIKSTIRMVDSAQYTRRLNVFDYDIVVGNFAQSDSPGNEQRDFWGSEAADREGSPNLIGVKSPAIDKLIDHVIFAKDRAELVAATQRARPRAAMERVRGAAMVLAECAHRLLGPLRPAQGAAGADAGLPSGLVVRPGARRASCRGRRTR